MIRSLQIGPMTAVMNDRVHSMIVWRCTFSNPQLFQGMEGVCLVFSKCLCIREPFYPLGKRKSSWLWLWGNRHLVALILRNEIVIFKEARSRVLCYPLPKQEDGNEGQDDARCDDLAGENVGREGDPDRMNGELTEEGMCSIVPDFLEESGDGFVLICSRPFTDPPGAGRKRLLPARGREKA
jgi:hypothetical protein